MRANNATLWAPLHLQRASVEWRVISTKADQRAARRGLALLAIMVR